MGNGNVSAESHENKEGVAMQIFCDTYKKSILTNSNGMQEELTEEKKLAVKFLFPNIPLSNSIQESKDIETSPFSERILKRIKLNDWRPMYIDTRFIIPTTNIAERFFSKAEYSLGKRR